MAESTNVYARSSLSRLAFRPAEGLFQEHRISWVAVRVLESRPGYTVCGKAANGSEAVSKARELNPDLVILDLKMPDMTGFEAARQILEFAPTLPILMFSMHFSAEYLQVARQIGIRGYVRKGSSFETLFEGLETLLRGEEFFLAKTQP
jgi:DNA-binding NarL/FixJ family response regulator